MTSIFSVQLGNGRIYSTLENLTQSVAGCRIMMLSELCLQTYPDSDLLPGAQPTLSTLQRVLSLFLSPSARHGAEAPGSPCTLLASKQEPCWTQTQL